MRRLTQKRKSKKGLILLLAIFSVAFIGIIFLKFNLLNVNQAEVKSDQIDCATSDELKDLAGLLGQNILFIDEVSIEKKIKDKFLCVRNIDLKRNLPGKVTLEIYGRRPVAILIEVKEVDKISTGSGEASLSAKEARLPDGQASASSLFNFYGSGEPFLTDNEGVIFAKKEVSGIPRIYFEGISLSVGKKLEEEVIKNALKILERIKIFGVEIKEAKIYSQNTLLVNGVPKMIFSLDPNLDLQLAALQLLLEQAKISEERMEFIDLRFEKPIVKYAPKKVKK